MVLKRTCYNYGPNGLKKYKKVTAKNEPVVLLVKLEDDPHLPTYMLGNNITTDFKKFRGCSAKETVKQNVLENLDRSIHRTCKDENNDSANYSDHVNLKPSDVSSINKMMLDFTDNNASNQEEDKLLGVTESSRSTVDNVENNTSVLTSRKETCSDTSSSCLPTTTINNYKKIKPGPASRRKGKTNIKISKNGITATNKVATEFSSDNEISNTKNDSAFSARKIPVKRKIRTGIEEPLSLISKLTGCQVSPNKVKVLRLTSCVSNSQGSCNTPSSDQIITEKDNLPDVRSNGISHQTNLVVTSVEKHEINGMSSLKKLETCKEEIRTVYDVMDYISVVLPGWNLHILSDTNTFCICYVSRNKSGIPCLSKCIELDDDFNGKVYINEQHNEQFDGVYNSEDAVVGLIKKIDALH